jgi:hypothetical protein
MVKYAYIHTVAGRLARYVPGEQIVHSSASIAEYHPKLVPTLAKIKSEQDKSNKWRLKKGLLPALDYGCVKIEL